MLVFVTLLFKLIPLYIIILLGFIAGKFLKAKKESVAPIVIYIASPLIFFNGAMNASLSFSTLSLPFLSFGIASIVCLSFLLLGKSIWADATKNLLAFATGDGNTGYFGLPVAIILFDQHLVNLYILCVLGINLYENTVAFFVLARGHHTVWESVKKVFSLPSLYAFFIGLGFNVFGFHLRGSIYTDFLNNFKGAYTILGMMLIGLGIADIAKFELDALFTSLAFLGRFFVWPIIAIVIIFLDSISLHLYNAELHKIIILLSIVPLAANTVAFATQLKVHPEKASLTVLLSTLFALFYIPLVVTFFLR